MNSEAVPDDATNHAAEMMAIRLAIEAIERHKHNVITPLQLSLHKGWIERLQRLKADKLAEVERNEQG